MSKFRLSTLELISWLMDWTPTDPDRMYEVSLKTRPDGVCDMLTVDLIWTQAELREHVLKLGMSEEDFQGEIIPQGVKFIASFQPPITEKEIERAKEIIKELKNVSNSSSID